MALARSLVLALLVSTAAIAVPVVSLAHCPPAKAKPHKAKAKVKKFKPVACNCAVAAKPKPRPRPHPRPAPMPPAPPPVDHAPYADSGDYGYYGPSRVVDLNVEGWESATYTSRIVDHRIITVVHDPRFCHDRRHRHH